MDGETDRNKGKINGVIQDGCTSNTPELSADELMVSDILYARFTSGSNVEISNCHGGISYVYNVLVIMLIYVFRFEP